MFKSINFDMDGTLADLYGVENWLDYLMAENVTPYVEAKPMLNLSSLARILNKLQREGYKINVISWLSKNSSTEYDKLVTEAKIEWLTKHLKSVKFDNISIIPYGTPKSEYGYGILFDDEELNRYEWGEGSFDETRIMEILKGLT